MRTIVAQALERNSRLLTQLAGRRGVTPVENLVPELQQQGALWRLFLNSPQQSRAEDAGERLQQIQQTLDAAVLGLAEARRMQDALTNEDAAEAIHALNLVAQQLERRLEQDQPRRALEQLLFVDAAALRELAADTLDPGPQDGFETALAANMTAEARNAERACGRLLREDAGPDLRLRARRRLQAHLAQVELFAGSLSEEARRHLWYRNRLLRVLERYAGIDVLLAGLEELVLTRQLTSREQRLLAAQLVARQASLAPRAERLYRHGFPLQPQAPALGAAGQLPAANADRLDEPTELKLRGTALP